MADQAKVTSIDALESFRASLIVFMNSAGRSVDEVGDDVRRTRLWVQEEQRFRWEREIRKRQKLLDAAKQELMSAKLSGLRDNLSAQENAVRKAKQALTEAEEKLRNVKKWARDFDHALDPLMKKLDGLRQWLNSDIPKGIAYLLQAQKTLEAYSDIAPRTNSPTPLSDTDKQEPAP